MIKAIARLRELTLDNFLVGDPGREEAIDLYIELEKNIKALEKLNSVDKEEIICDWITVKGASQFLGITGSTVHRRVGKSKCKTRYIGEILLILIDDVKYLEKDLRHHYDC